MPLWTTQQEPLLEQEEIFALQPESVERSLDLAQAEINVAEMHIGLAIAENRAQAAQLLSEAEERLGQLHVAGRLAGYERQCGKLLQAIRDDRTALQASESAVTEGQTARSAVDSIERP